MKGKLTILALFAVFSGLLFRGLEARDKSLWIDEFHTLDIASAPDLPGVVEAVSPDFHAPLHYFGVHALRHLDPHLLRLISGIVGLLALLPLLGLARSFGMNTLGCWAIAITFLLLPWQIRYGMELRPYAWLQLATLLVTWGAFGTQGRSGIRFAAVVIGAALGLYTHYLASLVLPAIGFVRLFVRSPGWLPLGKLIIAGTLGVLAFLPWVLSVESWIFEDPGVMTRNEKVDDSPAPARPPFAERLRGLSPQITAGLARTAVPAIRQLGRPSFRFAQAGGLLFLLALAFGGFTLVTRRGESESLSRGYYAVLASALVSTVALVLLCAAIWDRIPVQYFAISAWGWPLLAGGLVHAAARRQRGAPAFALLALSLVVLGAAHVFGDSRENLREGVRRAGELSGPVVHTAIMRQPEHYLQTTAYAVYSPELQPREPQDVPAVRELAPGTRIVVLSRSTSPEDPKSSTPALWRGIEKGRVLEQTISIDSSVRLYVYAPRPDQ